MSILICLIVLPSQLFSQSIPGSEITGDWNLVVETENGERPSWLRVKASGINALIGQFVGIDGSARPVSEIKYSEHTGIYSFTIPPQWMNIDTNMHMEFTHSNGQLTGTTSYGSTVLNWTATRAPKLIRKDNPTWGNPINLIDENLSKWKLADNNQFHVEDGILINQETGGHLITKDTFSDFKISLEYNIPEGSNSGLYLRGRYEVQIMDSYGMEPSSTGVGGVYGFIKPIVNAAKPAGEWQTLEVTLIGRLVTVVHNGVEVICNRPIPGTTGGAIDSHEAEPGPIFLQGDHGPVSFRNIEITPAIEN
ncbi:MAG: DUF1080 domain-containing protein [Balneolaceae bacterium]|nr:DUF1080 domain-containing protein [Balneolaceae bacterium]